MIRLGVVRSARATFPRFVDVYDNILTAPEMTGRKIVETCGNE
jgi:hypothetical protein